jgi:DNA mismatch repair protein MutS
MGDFLRTFYDTRQGSQTARHHPVPPAVRPPSRSHAGVPVHAYEGYLARLVALGESVRSASRSAIRRWPRAWSNASRAHRHAGTVTDEALLSERRDTLLLAIGARHRIQGWRFGWHGRILPAGRFLVTEVANEDALEAELARLEPAEILLPDDDLWPTSLRDRNGVRRRAPWLFDGDSGRRQLLQFFGAARPDGFGIDDKRCASRPPVRCSVTSRRRRKQRLPHLTAIAVEASDGAIAMNAATRTPPELDTRSTATSRTTLLGSAGFDISPMAGASCAAWLHRRCATVRRCACATMPCRALIESRAFEPCASVFARSATWNASSRASPAQRTPARPVDIARRDWHCSPTCAIRCQR